MDRQEILKRLEQIETRLAKATPGPLIAHAPDDMAWLTELVRQLLWVIEKQELRLIQLDVAIDYWMRMGMPCDAKKGGEGSV